MITVVATVKSEDVCDEAVRWLVNSLWFSGWVIDMSSNENETLMVYFTVSVETFTSLHYTLCCVLLYQTTRSLDNLTQNTCLVSKPLG